MKNLKKPDRTFTTVMPGACPVQPHFVAVKAKDAEGRAGKREVAPVPGDCDRTPTMRRQSRVEKPGKK